MVEAFAAAEWRGSRARQRRELSRAAVNNERYAAAAKRRKNAAHGASRGDMTKRGAKPEGAKEDVS